MPRPEIVEQNFFEFQAALRRAEDQGSCILPSDKQRWKSWVRENKVQEAAFRSIAQRRFDEPKAVILDEEGPWRGYYLYTPVEEVCLKFTRE
jgi:hypothetical protein